MTLKLRRWGPFALSLTLLLALLSRLESVPPLWWDEGWTLSVARNWVERGHYGRLLMGKPAPAGLEAAFPVTASVAASFRMFGIGITQGRLVFVVFLLAALVLLVYLGSRFYNPSVGFAALVVLILMTGHLDIQPLVVGRQVLAEVPALLFLFAGYACLLWAGEKSLWFLSGAIGLWSLALVTKAQVPPFWLASLLVPLAVALVKRKWRAVHLLITGIAGAILLSMLWRLLIPRVHTEVSASVSGLTELIAIVFDRRIRGVVVLEILQFGLPTLLGFTWTGWKYLKRESQLDSYREFVRLAIFTLGASWFAWYVLFSIGWPRYMFPAVFIGSIFVAVMLYDWTNGFNVKETVQRSGAALRSFRFDGTGLRALAAVLLVALSLGQSITVVFGAYWVNSDDSAIRVATFLNSTTSRDALIETYESELFFLLERRYHYPPDQVHVDLIRRNSFGERIKIDYDPLAANPDYLVVGPQSKFWDFYDPYLKMDGFRLLHDYSRYQIYERVR
jgi:hypothetical protein